MPLLSVLFFVVLFFVFCVRCCWVLIAMDNVAGFNMNLLFLPVGRHRLQTQLDALENSVFLRVVLLPPLQPYFFLLRLLSPGRQNYRDYADGHVSSMPW